MAITLEAQNYRVLRRTAWNPSRVSVVVGPNGSGKSTLLSLVEFFRFAFSRGVSGAIDALGGAWGLRHLEAPPDDPVVLGVGVDDLHWELQMSVRGASVDERPGERVWKGDEVLLRRPSFSDQIEYRGKTLTADNRLGLARIWDAERDDTLAPLVTALSEFRVYRGYNLGGLRQNGSRQNANLFLSPSGENAFTVLRNWRDRREQRPLYDFVLQGLRSAFPEICQDIDFDLAGVTVSVGMILPRPNVSVPAYYAPNGWLTGLLHLCAVAGAEPGSVVAIDEVENTLHPFAIRQLIAAFRDWAEERDLTICLASHSPVVLDEFRDDPARVFVMDSSEPANPTSLVEMHDPEWLRQFSLGRLYELGEFGAQHGTASTR